MNIAFHNGGGLGDAVVGVYAGTALARRGHKIEFHSRFPWWFAPVVREPGMSFHTFSLTAVDSNARYHEQLKELGDADCPIRSRCDWYLDNIAKAAHVEQLHDGELPVLEAPKRPENLPNHRYAILAPYSAHKAREWPMAHWLALAQKLRDGGIEPFMVMGQDQLKRATEDLAKTGTIYFWGQSPEWVLGAIANAAVVVGNDSGVAHLGGLMQTPTVAVVAQIRPDFVFAPATVYAVVPDAMRWRCRFCSWQKERGYSRECECLALRSIDPEQVAERVFSVC